MTTYKITRKCFRYFCDRLRFYVHNYSLKDWELDIAIGTENPENRATCITSLEDRYCKITIDPAWDVEPTDAALNKAAFHEATEILLAPIDALMKERFVSISQINDARHSVIMRLQNLLVD
uniref:Uncharacterized protein n=1 Tax=viral metagenome TaxID=1070528 RepID=A0A6M3LH25_9ZZZZ